MTDGNDRAEDLAARIVVDPEPTDEELVAILEVLRTVMDADQQPVGQRVQQAESRWERTARWEGLRSSTWPPQMTFWATGNR